MAAAAAAAAVAPEDAPFVFVVLAPYEELEAYVDVHVVVEGEAETQRRPNDFASLPIIFGDKEDEEGARKASDRVADVAAVAAALLLPVAAVAVLGGTP
mmetsp:Transcript_29569/g.65539  ORF Transcript_29569/g.65539 Transcript_29569/m.65539 type:complete len:99 (-) Transcript_29569:95-391(-)